MTTDNPFSVEKLPPINGASLTFPEELLDGSPLAEMGAEFIGRREQYREAVTELRELARQEQDARQSDRKTLNAALDAGKKDPGTPATDKLAAACVSARRRVEVRADATNAALKALQREFKFGDLPDAWANELRASLDASEARVAELLAEVEETIRATDRPLTLLAWLASRPLHNERRSLPRTSIYVAPSLESIRSSLAEARVAAETPPEPKRHGRTLGSLAAIGEVRL